MTIEQLIEEAVKPHTNDHNEEERWLRNCALSPSDYRAALRRAYILGFDNGKFETIHTACQQCDETIHKIIKDNAYAQGRAYMKKECVEAADKIEHTHGCDIHGCDCLMRALAALDSLEV